MKSVVLIFVLLFGFQVQASTVVKGMSCIGDRGYIKIYLKLGLMQFNEANKSATLKAYKMTFLMEEKSDETGVTSFDSGIFVGKDLQSLAYNGQKYKDHYKLELLPRKAENSGTYESLGMNTDWADLIVSPKYVVTKSIPHENHWHPEIKWTEEIRRHSAVLDLSLSDHHGDYVPLECYSQGKVDVENP